MHWTTLFTVAAAVCAIPLLAAPLHGTALHNIQGTPQGKIIPRAFLSNLMHQGNSEVLQHAETVAATSPQQRLETLKLLRNKGFQASLTDSVDRVEAAAARARGATPKPLTEQELNDLANLRAVSTKAGIEHVQSRPAGGVATLARASMASASLERALRSGITSSKSTLKQSSIASENLKAFNKVTGQNTPVPWTRGKKLATGLGVTAGVGVGGGVAGYMESKNT